MAVGKPEDSKPTDSDTPTSSSQEEDVESGFEYTQLNDALDEISSCLDVLEKRNEALHRELSNLLESNRQIRRELQQQQQV